MRTREREVWLKRNVVSEVS